MFKLSIAENLLKGTHSVHHSTDRELLVIELLRYRSNKENYYRQKPSQSDCTLYAFLKLIVLNYGISNSFYSIY